MKLALKKAATSQTILIFIQNSSLTTGAGLTGLVFNSASLTCYYARPRAAAVAVTLATQTVSGAFSSGGFVEVDAANMPGVYRLDIPDAALATGVDSVGLLLKGATNMAALPIEIQLTTIDMNDANGGLANLDAAVTSRLAPTVAARTLDVSATGEAGVDWANVGGQATAVNLSATTTNLVNIATTATAVTSLAAGAITAASIAADAITAAKIADGAIDALTFAAGAIDAAAIATDAIGSAEFSQAAADKVWLSVARTLTAFGFSVTVGTNNDKTGYALTTLESAVLHSGTATAGAAGTITLAAGASATDSLYIGDRIKLYGGTGAGQSRTCTAYNGTTKVATVDRNWVTNPDATSTYAVIEADNADLDAALQVARVTLSDTVTTLTGHTPQTGDNFARLGAPVGASISADIAAKPTSAQNATAVFTTVMAESYRSAGAAPTLAQFAFEVLAGIHDSAFSGTTKTIRKLDGTTAKTFTLNSAVTPTDITEAT